MSHALQVVVVSGGAFSPSRTLVLAQAILDELQTRLCIESHLIELGDIARQLGGALSRAELGAEVAPFAFLRFV